MSALFLLALVAWADPADALDPVTRGFYLEAQRLEQQEDYDGASLRYQKVRELDPFFDQASLDLGRTLEALGNEERAEAVYLEEPFDADCVEALGRLYLRQERFDAALDAFERLWPLSNSDPEVLRLQVMTLARIDAVEADKRFRDYLRYDHVVRPSSPEVAELALVVAHSLQGAGEEDLALAVLQNLRLQAGPTEGSVYDDLLDSLRIRRQARQRAAIGARPLQAVQRQRLEQSRILARSDPAAARHLLEGLVKASPRNAEVRSALAEVAEQLGDIDAAVQNARLATQLAPANADHLVRYGDLLTEHYGGRYDAAAIDAYERAVARKRDSAVLWYRKARVEQRSGQIEAAMRSFRQVAALDDDGSLASEAQEVLDGYERQLPEFHELPAVPSRTGVQPFALEAFYIALEYFERAAPGDLERSREAVDEALSIEPSYVDALNLSADLSLRAGDEAEARAAYRRSLEVDSDQPGALVNLAALERRLGNEREGRRLLLEASRLGAADAIFYEAEAAADRGAWLETRSLLKQYFAAPPSPLTRDRAVDLQAAADQRILGVQLGIGGLVLVLVLTPLLVVAWRRTGASVRELLERAPSSARSVARVCSRLGHEVVKHNTTVLPAVAAALERGDPEPAQWLAERLWAKDGAIHRFWEAVGEIEQIGRNHGIRLNLRVRDPAFSQLTSGIVRLTALQRDLGKGNRAIAPELRALSVQLNERGYRSLGRLLARACVLEISAATLADVWARVREEPAFRDLPSVDFHLEAPHAPLHLRIYPSDLEDILANLLRNSLQATLESGGSRVGVRVDTTEDWVTGLERVRIAVLDDAPRRISTAMIRGRYIERGLGLAVDLISRNGGSIGVEDADGWSKQVVVALPVAETEEL